MRYLYGQDGVAADAKKVLADPLLANPGSGGTGLASVDGYKLTAGSPAVLAGLTIPASGGSDYWGSPVPPGSRPNLGACNAAPVAAVEERYR